MLGYYLKRVILWTFRMGYSRGFGVQSPSSYSFLRYVVNEHYPYYAYQNLKNESGNVGPLILKLSRFYFRMANYCQSDLKLAMIAIKDMLLLDVNQHHLFLLQKLMILILFK